MSLPANIRINVKVPFPTSVSGSSFIQVQKVNGIWTISPNYALLAQQLTIPNSTQKLVVIYDTLTGAYTTTSLAVLLSFANRAQRSITASGQLPITVTDNILNFNSVSDLTPSIPLASTRSGAPYTLNNMPGSHTQTFSRTGTDTFDGATSLALAGGSRMTLVPYNDGVNNGYFID